MANPAVYAQQIDALLHNTALDDIFTSSVIARQVNQESHWNEWAVSPKGAMGLMQLMPATAASLKCEAPFKPEANVVAGVTYLARLRGMLRHAIGGLPATDQMAWVLAAYNWGPGNVLNFLHGRLTHALPLTSKDWISELPHETQQYVTWILQLGA